MSAPEHADRSAARAPRLGAASRTPAGRREVEDGIAAARAARGAHRTPAPIVSSRMTLARPSACAWGAIAAAAAFIAITCWWLTQDRSIPIYDAGDQLETALVYRAMLHAGNLLGPFKANSIYPILGHIVGAVAALIGGVSLASPIVGENLVFVPLLALGCYQTGRLLFGRLAGMLAVVFVLGSPLLISIFHVFLLDGPLTAMVAVSVWLLLASEDFGRTRTAALAGLMVGLGVNLKVQFALFVAGLTAIMLLRGGWRNRDGFTAFAVIALAVGLPWYLVHSSELGEMFSLASSGPGTPPGNIPPTLSTANLGWYFWSVMNSQLLAPLWVLFAIGAGWTTVTVLRARGAHATGDAQPLRGMGGARETQAARAEFLGATFTAWLIVTFVTPHHDIRYGLPLLAFVAVMATGWIAHAPRWASFGAIAVLALGVLANTLAINLGIGSEVKLALAAKPAETEQLPDRVIVYTPTGFLVSAPSRDGDVPGLLAALDGAGVRTVTWSAQQSLLPDFSDAGLMPLVEIAGLTPAPSETLQYASSASVATLIHEAANARKPAACTKLSDGTDVWVVRFDQAAGKLALFCPGRNPSYYAVGTIR